MNISNADRRRFRSASPSRSVATRFRRRDMLHELGTLRWDSVPSLAEAERRMRRGPGFLESLTPEQWAAIRSYDGPEILGAGG
jgi:hypothetical protein